MASLSKLRRTASTTIHAVKKALYALVGIVVVFGLFLSGIQAFALYFMPESKVGYFPKYATLRNGYWTTADFDQVVVDKRPHDCEWMTAPLGEKHCHYEPNVFSVRIRKLDDGVVVVSFDAGHTEQPATGSEVPEIFVRWNRVTE